MSNVYKVGYMEPYASRYWYYYMGKEMETRKEDKGRNGEWKGK